MEDKRQVPTLNIDEIRTARARAVQRAVDNLNIELQAASFVGIDCEMTIIDATAAGESVTKRLLVLSRCSTTIKI